MAMNNRLLRPLASGFDPRRIANCTSWFDAGRSLVLDTTGGTTTASTWPNLVSGGANFVQSVKNDQPSVSTLGGRTALVFSASGTLGMNGPSIADAGNTSTNTLLMFFVIQYTGTSNTVRLFLTQSTGGFTWGWFPRYSDNNSYMDFPGVNRVSGSITATTINTAPTICRLRRADALASLHYNAIQIGSRSNASGALFSNTAALIRVQGQDTNNSVSCSEIITFSRDITASEIATVEKGLARKYGVTI